MVKGSLRIHLHSTMFLLIRITHAQCKTVQSHLHSTMFLLIRSLLRRTYKCYPDLHSTMFLLIPQPEAPEPQRNNHLHSTMFLLIPTLDYVELKGLTIYIPLCFYLYLRCCNRKEGDQTNLHSTMFLLIRDGSRSIWTALISFTFHYVSTYTTLASALNLFALIYIPLCFYLYEPHL